MKKQVPLSNQPCLLHIFAVKKEDENFLELLWGRGCFPPSKLM